jgi:hypothetical protein
MKRPQFGLRLMLLIVAFAATIFAWQYWVHLSRMREYNLRNDVRELTGRIDYLEHRHLVSGQPASLTSEEIAEVAAAKQKLSGIHP